MAQQRLLDETAAPLVPPRPSLRKLREAAAVCKACPLWDDENRAFHDDIAKTRVVKIR